MNAGISEVGSERISSVLRANPFQVVGHFRERFVPRDLFPTTCRATNRLLQPVLIEVNVLQRNGFGTNVSAAKRVILIAANVELLSIANSDLDAADRFTEMTVTKMRSGFHDMLLVEVSVHRQNKSTNSNAHFSTRRSNPW
jgi:hypothetical protein